VDGDRAIKLSEREERLISIPSITCRFLAKKLAFQKKKRTAQFELGFRERLLPALTFLCAAERH